MLKDSARPKSGAEVFLQYMEADWEGLKQQLLKLPAWFRVLQFLAALGAENNLKNLVSWRETENARNRKKKDTTRPREKKPAQPEVLDAMCLLWYEVLDPVNRALLEDYAGLNDEEAAPDEAVAMTAAC